MKINPGRVRGLGLKVLNSPDAAEGQAVTNGYRTYRKAIAALKDLRDHSKLNQHTPVISAGRRLGGRRHLSPWPRSWT
jgi:hypothetical protein